jgi:hypothetical protein
MFSFCSLLCVSKIVVITVYITIDCRIYNEFLFKYFNQQASIHFSMGRGIRIMN